MGADEVIGISRREDKRQQALALGCDGCIATADDESWAIKNADQFDLIISTISSSDPKFNNYLLVLSFDVTPIQVAAPEKPMPLAPFALIFNRRRIAASALASPKEIAEMLHFCVDKNEHPYSNDALKDPFAQPKHDSN